MFQIGCVFCKIITRKHHNVNQTFRALHNAGVVIVYSQCTEMPYYVVYILRGHIFRAFIIWTTYSVAIRYHRSCYRKPATNCFTCNTSPRTISGIIDLFWSTITRVLYMKLGWVLLSLSAWCLGLIKSFIFNMWIIDKNKVRSNVI